MKRVIQTRANKKKRRSDGRNARKEQKGVELNHTRHPLSGIAWCDKCINAGRAG